MNREILFKAKRLDNGEWVEGYLFEFQPCQYMICDKKEYERSSTLPVLCFFRCCGYEIDPDTLCEYTGLTDKNGKRIWENDILMGHGNDRDLSKVLFGKFYVIDVETLNKVDEVIGWHTEVIETDTLSKCEPFCLPMPLTDFYIKRSEFEVFGNEFDNADLLEVE